MKTWALLGLVTAALTLPFINRPYFVDDFYFVTMAKGILEHPLRPYDFRADDAGKANLAWEKGQRPRMVNPPLFHYYLAGVIRFAGNREWVLRTSMIPWVWLSLVFCFALARRWTAHPWMATLLAAVTPAFWLTSYSLLIDGMLLALGMAGLWALIRAHEDHSTAWLAASGLLLGAAVLTKYVGVLFVALALAYHLMNPARRRWPAAWLVFVVVVMTQLLWAMWNVLTYGLPHLWATLPRGFRASTPAGAAAVVLAAAGLVLPGALRIGRIRLRWTLAVWLAASILWVWGLLRAESVASWMMAFYFDKALILGAFAGGGCVFLALSWHHLWKESRLLTFGWLLFLSALGAFLAAPAGGFTPAQSGQMVFWIGAAGAAFLALGASDIAQDDEAGRFLRVWIALGILELMVVMPWTAGRYLLSVLPAAALLMVRSLSGSRRLLVGAIASTALVGLMAAASDHAQADTIRRLAEVLPACERPSDVRRAASEENRKLHAVRRRRSDVGRCYYLGDTFSGMEPYLAPLGFQAAFPDEPFRPGDRILIPRIRTSSWWRLPETLKLEPVEAYEFNSALALRVMDIPNSAGWYASVWGSLPFVITTTPLERFELYRVR